MKTIDPEIVKEWTALQKHFQKELKKRAKTTKSTAELMRGLDDYFREKTARFLFKYPSFTSEWIGSRASELSEDLRVAKNETDYLNLLIKISARSPLAKATSECPQYAIVPPIMKPPEKWVSLLDMTSPTITNIQYFIKNGFMPVAASVVENAIARIGQLNIAIQSDYTLLDTDYGIAILPSGLPQKNISLDTAMLQRYIESLPTIVKYPSDIFDIGILRGERFYNCRESEYPTLITLDVSNRQELDNILNRIRQNIATSDRYELWFRGQPQEYLLPDFRREAFDGICPWRSVQDISLIPSIYRNISDQLSNLHRYCQRHIEVYKYYLFLKETLGIPTYTTRGPNASSYELFDKNWGSQFPEFTSTMSTGNGEAIEHHDTHFAFRSLQAALFLQHYGLDSNILDLTKDIDVALFFAQKQLNGNNYSDVDYSLKNPVLYFFILDKELDPFINTAELLERYDVLRPKRQLCGILSGASVISKNYYSRFISLKINLRAPIHMNYNEPQFLFPKSSEDIFLRNLIQFCSLQKMSIVKPFFLEE